jgi:hypothetical protein
MMNPEGWMIAVSPQNVGIVFALTYLAYDVRSGGGYRSEQWGLAILQGLAAAMGVTPAEQDG